MKALSWVTFFFVVVAALWLILRPKAAPIPQPTARTPEPSAGQPAPSHTVAPAPRAQRGATAASTTRSSAPAQPPRAPGVAPSEHAPQPIMFAKRVGPVDEYIAQFEREPRDSAATDLENTIHGVFNNASMPAGLLRSVLCRESICRLEVHVSSAQLGNYVAGMTKISSEFEGPIAIAPVGEPTGDGEQTVELYAKRKRD